MRVLMSVDGVGGVLAYAIALIRGLRALDAGLEVTVAGLGPALGAGARRRLLDAGAVDVVELGGALEWMPGRGAEADATAAAFAALARELLPDLVHANAYGAALAVRGQREVRAPVLVVAHSDVVTWWQAVHGQSPPSEWAGYRRLVGRALAGADAIACPTAAHADAVRASYGPGLPLAVILNGLDPDAAPASAAGEVAANAGVGMPDGPFALAAGRFDDAGKGLDTLLGAARGLTRPLLVAGPLPPDRRAGVQLGSLELLGRLDPEPLARLRARATAFVSTARYEPFGLAVLEAAHAGCALVLPDLPGFRELWDGAARFTPSGDPEALAADLRCLLEPGGAASLGIRAQRRATRFSAAAMAAAYRDLYVTTVAAGRSAVPA